MKPELQQLKNTALVIDIETSAIHSNGTEVSIRSSFDDYVNLAEVKWVGMYSYKHNKSYELNVATDTDLIVALIEEHNILVGFNSEDFDLPILKHNGLISQYKKYIGVDAMVILGTANRKTKSDYPFKNRGELMDYKFKSNSLKCIAETMGLETQKGDIDYSIFHKNKWTEQETKDIIKYLNADVMATKQMFDKLWDFWLPFTEFVDETFVYDLSWIRNSIASLTYKSACKVYGVEPTYGEHSSAKEEMGGRVIEPKYEEAKKVWYIDFGSLYPHIQSMWNLFSEVDPNEYKNAWHGNKLFGVKGHYDISSWNPLSKEISKRIAERMRLKKEHKDSPMVYTLKIWLNALYGASRSSIFEKIHTPNIGWDTCLLGRQIQELTEDMMESFGFETIMGDTDSIFVIANDEKDNSREYVQECLNQIIEVIKDNAPFPVDTFKIDIEDYLEYIVIPFSLDPIVDEETRKLLNNGEEVEHYIIKEEDKKKIIVDTRTDKIVKRGRRWVKERRGKKKNYMYIYKDGDEMKTKITGLPIKKDNATQLAMKIFKEVLEPRILKECSAKFEKKYMESILDKYLKDKEVLKSLAVEYKVNANSTYKTENQIQAQISRGYFDGNQGVIRLIKNTKIGKAGKGNKYCTLEEALDAKLTIEDIDLEKVRNELAPFVIYEEVVKVKKPRKKKSKVIKMVKDSIDDLDKAGIDVTESKKQLANLDE